MVSYGHIQKGKLHALSILVGHLARASLNGRAAAVGLFEPVRGTRHVRTGTTGPGSRGLGNVLRRGARRARGADRAVPRCLVGTGSARLHPAPGHRAGGALPGRPRWQGRPAARQRLGAQRASALAVPRGPEKDGQGALLDPEAGGRGHRSARGCDECHSARPQSGLCRGKPRIQ